MLLLVVGWNAGSIPSGHRRGLAGCLYSWCAESVVSVPVLRIATGKGKRVASVLGAERRCPWCRCSGRPRGGLAERRCFRCWASVISVPASDPVSLLLDCCAHRVSRLGRASSEVGWRVAWIGAIERWYGWVRLAWGRVWGGGVSGVRAGWFGEGWGGGRVRCVWGSRARAGG